MSQPEVVSKKIKFLGELVDLDKLEKSGFIFIEVNDAKKSPLNFINLYYFSFFHSSALPRTPSIFLRLKVFGG